MCCPMTDAHAFLSAGNTEEQKKQHEIRKLFPDDGGRCISKRWQHLETQTKTLKNYKICCPMTVVQAFPSAGNTEQHKKQQKRSNRLPDDGCTRISKRWQHWTTQKTTKNSKICCPVTVAHACASAYNTEQHNNKSIKKHSSPAQRKPVHRRHRRLRTKMVKKQACN